ncbi:tyrosine-type recombinase/integrase [Nitrospirillum viridazoti]|uniref:tyrosine-type recombinase/integrase n=1 Tax=Nitrospirillum viridazoti TaxID=3144925 RepID=UPI000A69251D|nr:site-specific integrase [Nitrospirillum amazonense]TWB29342.1 integrase [Nitrospirillum amazonense]
MAPTWKNPVHVAQWHSTLERYAFPVIGELRPAEVTTDHILKILRPIWYEITETAARLRGRLERTLDAARVLGLRDGENPARWSGHLEMVLPAYNQVRKRGHHAAVHYDSMPEFFPRLQVHDGLGARALELAVLTATRTSEVLHATWSEIDLTDRSWTVPAARMKAGAEHRVPLTEPALALLRKLASLRTGEFIFPGQKAGQPLSNMAMRMVLKRTAGYDGATPHGFRATFRTWAAEKTTHAFDVAEAALAHTQKDKTVAAYQRGDLFDKRRALMEDWASFCLSRPDSIIDQTKCAAE